MSNARYYFSNKMISEGEIKDAKLSSFSSDFQTLIKLYFLCIFFMKYDEFEKNLYMVHIVLFKS